MLEIMEKYGWDFYTYEKQPSWILDLAVKKIGIEAKKSKQASESAT
jgi:hypothetical protein